MRLDLESETYARTGNIAADGFRNLMGRPSLALVQTVLRESIQNCVDAANPGTGPSILIRIRTLTPEQHSVLARRVFPELPEDSVGPLSIRKSLGKPALRVFEICDFRTRGLGGPTSANVVPSPNEAPDFVNFMRNIGSPRDVDQGGGTYGYGKTVLYSLSACATIIVDTLTTVEGSRARRFMASHVGSTYETSSGQGGGERFTGRHWWGAGDAAGDVEPVIGRDARELATELGLRFRREHDTGTTIMIIDPLLPEDDDALECEVIETILWNLWPRLTRTTPDARRIDIQLEVEGRTVEIPRPEAFAPLDLFAAALASHRAGGPELLPVRSRRPQKLLGALSLQKGLRGRRVRPADRTDTVIPSQSSHIALMRPVELVVKYIEGEPFPDHRFEWAGVFICSDESEVEEAFATAEPPAHDDWVPNMLPKGPQKTYVNVALRELINKAKSYAEPVPATVDVDGPGRSLARTAARMGVLLSSASARGPGRPRGHSRQPGPRATVSVGVPTFRQLEADEKGRPVAVFEATLLNDGSDADLAVEVEPHLIMEGSRTAAIDLPSTFSPEVLELRLDPRGTRSSTKRLAVGTDSGTIIIRVRSPQEAAISVQARLIRQES